MNKIEILDCTLRDGSYVIDNHFSKSDTSIISSILFIARQRRRRQRRQPLGVRIKYYSSIVGL